MQFLSLYLYKVVSIFGFGFDFGFKTVWLQSSGWPHTSSLVLQLEACITVHVS